ncbi:MAG: hypothetical protein M1840_008674 [Geoglossum simile]|nr:MAG: hypothetical protein M1840_008674 [Geoglossum simile]
MSPNLRRKPLPGSIARAESPPPPPSPSPSPPITATAIDIPDDHSSPPPPPLEKEPENHRGSGEGELEDGGSKPLPSLPPPPPQRWTARAQAHWRSTSRRRKILYTGLALTVVLALILSIALGIRGKKRQRHYNLLAATHTGDLTYYDPGLGACGQTSSSADYICAISYHLFDAAATSSNPNTNPLCGRRLWFARTSGPGALKKGDGGNVDPAAAHTVGEKVEVVVVDRCAGCEGEGDLDVTDTAFGKVAGVAEGRVGVVWGWAD